MWTETGFQVLHAKWPAYPKAHGVRTALTVLAEFPRKTRFFPIDNIDRCSLFVVGDKPKGDAFAAEHLHVAVWDDDLRECMSRGYIEGVREDGEYVTFPNESMCLTDKGLRGATIDALLGAALDVLDEQVVDYLHDARYDTAVREAALRVELALRHASGLKDNGRKLVDKCFGEKGVLMPQALINAERLNLRNAFRAYFKYVRNEYAHALPPVDMLTASVLVRRSALLLAVIRELDPRSA
jgi:hypothetical protein